MSESSTFKLSLVVPRRVSLPEQLETGVDRETFYEWVWSRFSEEGLLGVHEGTLLSEQATEQGFEMDSWTVDSGEAPPGRDWVARQDEMKAELFFSGLKEAENAASVLKEISELQVGQIEEQKPQDWDAEWKASFLNAGEGVQISPFWRIIPPWVQMETTVSERPIKINPGAGFGTGTHETTQLCLRAIGEASLRKPLTGQRALDFGSGSGILSVGLALLGATVDAVEVDPLAIDNARENAVLNRVEGKIRFSQKLSADAGQYNVVVANILKPVLLEFSEQLVQSLSSDGVLVLSGLIEKDVAPVLDRYSALLEKPTSSAQVFESAEWRAIVFQRD